MPGPRLRISIRRLMLATALLGGASAFVRQLFFANTVSARGFDVGRFRQVRVGMTTAQVEALVGAPLGSYAWQDRPDHVVWRYTAKRSGSGDYWKREVHFERGVVGNIIDCYYVD